MIEGLSSTDPRDPKLKDKEKEKEKDKADTDGADEDDFLDDETEDERRDTVADLNEARTVTERQERDHGSVLYRFDMEAHNVLAALRFAFAYAPPNPMMINKDVLSILQPKTLYRIRFASAPLVVLYDRYLELAQDRIDEPWATLGLSAVCELHRITGNFDKAVERARQSIKEAEKRAQISISLAILAERKASIRKRNAQGGGSGSFSIAELAAGGVATDGKEGATPSTPDQKARAVLTDSTPPTSPRVVGLAGEVPSTPTDPSLLIESACCARLCLICYRLCLSLFPSLSLCPCLSFPLAPLCPCLRLLWLLAQFSAAFRSSAHIHIHTGHTHSHTHTRTRMSEWAEEPVSKGLSVCVTALRVMACSCFNGCVCEGVRMHQCVYM